MKTAFNSKRISVWRILIVTTIILTSFSAFAQKAGIGKAPSLESDHGDVGGFISKMENEARQQFQKTKDNFLAEIEKAQAKIDVLRQDRKKVVAGLKALAKSEEKGMEFFKRYQMLIKLRASNKKGEYDAVAQLLQVDVDNINRLFKYFLSSIPFKGRVVAGIADRELIAGMERLGKLIEIHKNPNEQNNSDLAIIKRQEDELLQKIKIIETLGTQYNLFKKKK